GDPCGTCRVCRAVSESAAPEIVEENQSAHPGVRVVSLSRPDERELHYGAASARGEVRSTITVPQMRVVLAESLRTEQSATRIVTLDPADRLGESAANALLKTLEEPRPGERFVLISARPSALLPTIVSRCIRFRFELLSTDEVRRALVSGASATAASGPDEGV